MTVSLERIDSAPHIEAEDLSYFIMWLSVFIDTLNEDLNRIEESLNRYDLGLIAPSFTTAEITTLSVDAADGSIWYASDAAPPNVVLKINGSLVQLTTAPFP